MPRFIALRRYCGFFYLQIKGLWQPCVEQVYRRHFFNTMCSLSVSVSQIGNYRNISNFFIIIIMAICDVTTVTVLGRCYHTASHAVQQYEHLSSSVTQ
jgi:hypothetical protein